MTHGWKCAAKGPLIPVTVALMKADRDADLAAHGDTSTAHDEVLFNAAVAACQLFLAALDPGGSGQQVDVHVEAGCADPSHLVPYALMSKSWSVASPVGGVHSWTTSVQTAAGVLSPAEELAGRNKMAAHLAAQGRVVEAGDTSLFDAMVAAARSWIAALVPTTSLVVSFDVTVSNGSLQRVHTSTGIVAAQLPPPAPDPLAGVLTPPTLIAAAHNYSPAGLATAVMLRLSCTGTTNVSGLAGGSSLRQLFVVNVGGSSLNLIAHSLLSLAANRFLFDSNVNLGQSDGCHLIYDPVALGWRKVGVAT